MGRTASSTLFIDALDGTLRFKQAHTMDDLDLDIETGNHDTSISCWLLTTSDDQWFDEDGKVSGANPDAEGYSTFSNAKTVYNYWNNRFGHDSYDDDGEDVEMYIHVGQNWNNAHYSSGCDIFEFGDGYPVLDVVGHEYTHGVTHNFADLICQSQSGALNESFSDIFGYFVDSGDWLMGEDLPGGALRDLSNPAQGQPDRMADFVNTSNDDGGVRQQRHPQQGRLPDHQRRHAQRLYRAGHRQDQGRAAVLQHADLPALEQRAVYRRAQRRRGRVRLAVCAGQLLAKRRLPGQERLRGCGPGRRRHRLRWPGEQRRRRQRQRRRGRRP